MAKGIKLKIRRALKRVDREIAIFAKSGGHISAGLASEGYNGGYRDALLDVSLALSGVPPCKKREWWRE